MSGDPTDRIATLRDWIDDSPDITAADRDPLHAFDNRLTLLQQEYSAHRHEKLLRHAVLMAEVLTTLISLRT